jgi:dihydroorotase-like cyclic amidohydrolase
VAHAVQCKAATLRDAIDMASRNPARFFGFPEQGLRAGTVADLFLYRPAEEDQLHVVATIIAGELRFGAIESQSGG